MKNLKKIETSVFAGLLRTGLLFFLLYFSMKFGWNTNLVFGIACLNFVSLVWTGFRVSTLKMDVAKEWVEDMVDIAKKAKEEALKEVKTEVEPKNEN